MLCVSVYPPPTKSVATRFKSAGADQFEIGHFAISGVDRFQIGQAQISQIGWDKHRLWNCHALGLTNFKLVRPRLQNRLGQTPIVKVSSGEPEPWFPDTEHAILKSVRIFFQQNTKVQSARRAEQLLVSFPNCHFRNRYGYFFQQI